MTRCKTVRRSISSRRHSATPRPRGTSAGSFVGLLKKLDQASARLARVRR